MEILWTMLKFYYKGIEYNFGKAFELQTLDYVVSFLRISILYLFVKVSFHEFYI